MWVEASKPVFSWETTTKDFKINGKVVTAICKMGVGGNTQSVQRDVMGSPGPVLKMCILMKTLKTRSSGVVRLLGPGALKCYLFHELLHACGLQNSDHTFDDVFSANLTPQPMSNPQYDHVESITSRKLPPIFLNGNTVTGIAKLWV